MKASVTNAEDGQPLPLGHGLEIRCLYVFRHPETPERRVTSPVSIRGFQHEDRPCPRKDF